MVRTLKPCALGDRDVGGVEARKHAEQEGARGRRDLKRAVGREALLELGRRRVGDAERGGASASFAGRIDHGRGEGEDFHLALAVGEGLVDEELGALGGTVEPRFGLASHEAVEGQVGAPRQDEDESRTAQARAEEEATLQRGGGADDRLVRVGDRRHEMSRAEGASRVIEADARERRVLDSPSHPAKLRSETHFRLQASSFVLPEVRAPSRHFMTEFAATQPVGEQPAGYDPAAVERRWQARWETEATNETDLSAGARPVLRADDVPVPECGGAPRRATSSRSRGTTSMDDSSGCRGTRSSSRSATTRSGSTPRTSRSRSGCTRAS